MPDIKFSKALIDFARPYISGFDQAVDIGAAIGRVAKDVLWPAGFKAIDLVEPCTKML